MTITMSKMTRGTRQAPAITADLHIHSTASDGEYTPAEIAAMLEKNHIRIAALADHDSFGGFEEFREAFEGLAIPAAELSVNYKGGGFHLLTYGFDPSHRALRDRLEHFRKVRETRLEKMCERLGELGYPVSIAAIRKQCPPGTTLGRPHIARAMMAAGHVRSFNTAFHKYLGDGKPAYVPKVRMDFDEALALIRDAGGISILAHPGLYHRDIPFEQMMKMPVDGFEAYHPNHSPAYARAIIRHCNKRHLPCTGGSDFHDLRKNKLNVIGKWGLLEEEWLRVERVLRDRSAYGLGD